MNRRSSSGSLAKTVLLGAAAIGMMMMLRELPALRRYLRMRRM